jgi:flotillin
MASTVFGVPMQRAQGPQDVASSSNPVPQQRVTAGVIDPAMVEKAFQAEDKQLDALGRSAGLTTDFEVTMRPIKNWKEKFEIHPIVSSVLHGTKQLICQPHQVFVVHGRGVEGFLVTRNHDLRPGQSAVKVNVASKQFGMLICGVSKDDIRYCLPSSFSLGLVDANDILDEDSIKRIKQYVVYHGDLTGDYGQLESRMERVLKEAVNDVLSKMTADQIYAGVANIEDTVKSKTNEEMKDSGFKVFSCQFSPVRDDKTFGGTYFLLKGATERSRQQAQIDKDLIEIANKAEIDKLEVAAKKEKSMAEISNSKTLEILNKTLEVERKRAELNANNNISMAETKKNRDISEAQFNKESQIARDNAVNEVKINNQKLQVAYCQAQADLKLAEAERDKLGQLRIEKNATEIQNEINLAKAENDARIKVIEAKAEADKIKAMVEALGTPENYLQYFCMSSGYGLKIAEQNTAMMNGMAPKLSVITNGASSGAESGASAGDALIEFAKKVKTMNSAYAHAGFGQE